MQGGANCQSTSALFHALRPVIWPEPINAESFQEPNRARPFNVQP